MNFASETLSEIRLFELEYPFTKIDLKHRYRELVKKYYSDVNKGISEDMIKKINAAYSNLSKITLETIEHIIPVKGVMGDG